MPPGRPRYSVTMDNIRELELPVIVGEPQPVTVTCPECGATASGMIEFVATAVDTRTGEPLGTWSPAVYECESGHLTLESEI
jgi:hypothetical protein